jgi:hypothetical protein
MRHQSRHQVPAQLAPPNWKAWAEAIGESPGRQKDFLAKLDDRGFKEFRDPGGYWMVRGIALQPAETPV